VFQERSGRRKTPRAARSGAVLGAYVPLQLFSYNLARGPNPDGLRAEDARFARGGVSGRL
jgi:hypothetical protein